MNSIPRKRKMFLNRTQQSFSSLFRLAMLWNAVEAFGYQIVFFFYQLFLFKNISADLFAAQGVFFATGYLLITLINGAFEAGVIPVFSELSRSRGSFKKILFPLIVQTIFLFVVPLIIGWLIPSFSGMLLSLFVGLEGTKKNLRALLFLGFDSKFLAKIELLNIASYATLVCVLHYIFGIYDVVALVALFLLVSFVSVCFLVKRALHFYLHLPLGTDFNSGKLEQRFLISRLYSYANQLTRIFFSSNFLLPFLATFSCEAADVAVASLVNTVTFTCTSLIQKIFGPLGSALFAYAKYTDSKSKQSVFFTVTRAAWIVGFLLFLGALLYGLTVNSVSNLSAASFIGIFFLAHLVESCSIVYEKFFIAEEKQQYLLIFNLLVGALCLIPAAFTQHMPFHTTFKLCLAIRLISFYFLTKFINSMAKEEQFFKTEKEGFQ